jgi:hypothetical protein
MALLDSEVRRLRAELGLNVLTLGAEPYISITQILEQVVQNNVTAGAVTSSITAVVAASPPAVVSLTLTSATGFNSGDRVIVDVDSLQEYATVRSVSGSAISILLSLAHTGTYPVTVEGGESLIRGKLRKIIALEQQIDDLAPSGGVKQADEVQFFSPREMRSLLGPAFVAWEQREYERRELAALIGIEYPRDLARGAGGSVSVYG